MSTKTTIQFPKGATHVRVTSPDGKKKSIVIKEDADAVLLGVEGSLTFLAKTGKKGAKDEFTSYAVSIPNPLSKGIPKPETKPEQPVIEVSATVSTPEPTNGNAPTPPLTVVPVAAEPEQIKAEEPKPAEAEFVAPAQALQVNLGSYWINAKSDSLVETAPAATVASEPSPAPVASPEPEKPLVAPVALNTEPVKPEPHQPVVMVDTKASDAAIAAVAEVVKSDKKAAKAMAKQLKLAAKAEKVAAKVAAKKTKADVKAAKAATKAAAKASKPAKSKNTAGISVVKGDRKSKSAFIEKLGDGNRTPRQVAAKLVEKFPDVKLQKGSTLEEHGKTYFAKEFDKALHYVRGASWHAERRGLKLKFAPQREAKAKK